MTTIVCVKHNGGLIPADDDAQDVLSKLEKGKEVLVEVRAPRRIRQHKLFFGLLNLLVENSGAFINVEDALKRVKIACGEVDELIDADTGQVFYTLRSIAFASMDQTRFSALFDLAVKVIAERSTGRLVGVQIIGREDAGKRIDAAAVAVWHGMTVAEVASLDLGYAPPFAPVWDPLLIAARKAAESLTRG